MDVVNLEGSLEVSLEVEMSWGARGGRNPLCVRQFPLWVAPTKRSRSLLVELNNSFKGLSSKLH